MSCKKSIIIIVHNDAVLCIVINLTTLQIVHGCKAALHTCDPGHTNKLYLSMLFLH